MEIFVAASETNLILLEEIVDFDFRLSDTYNRLRENVPVLSLL